MSSANYQRVRPLDATETQFTVPSGGLVTPVITLDCSPFLGLQVPALTTCTLQISGCVSTAGSGGLMVPIVGKNGLSVLVYQNTGGSFFLGAAALEEILGCTHIQIGCGNSPQVAARAFTLLQRTSL
jgi:hypothetical protein